MYDLGVLVAFCFWSLGLVMILVKVNSQAERNLRKVGLRHSWINFEPKTMSPEHYKHRPLASVGKFVLIAALGIPGILMSWLYVALSMGMIAYSWSKDRGAPQEVREFRWRLKNQNLSFDDLAEWLHRHGKVADHIDDFKRQLRDEMSQVATA
jgi:hypothetical protein